MADLPEIVQFGALEASLQQVTERIAHHRITDRFNITHVKLYCRDFGIEFSDAYSYPGKGTLISRTKS